MIEAFLFGWARALDLEEKRGFTDNEPPSFFAKLLAFSTAGALLALLVIGMVVLP